MIEFADAKMNDLHNPKTKKLPKSVVIITAPLTADAAKMIKCGHLFKKNGDPINDPGSYKPPIKLGDCEIKIPSGTNSGVDTYRPEIIRSFTVTPHDDLSLNVTFRVHITGGDNAYQLLATRLKYIEQPFTCRIESLQESFDFSGKSGGTEVDMSGDESSGSLFVTTAQCAGCELDHPLNADGKHMHEGQLTDCARQNQADEEAESGEGSVASVATMRQLKKTKNGRYLDIHSKRFVSNASPEEIAAAVSVQ